MKAEETWVGRFADWFLIVASYAVLFFEPHWIGADGRIRFDALASILEHGSRPDIYYSLVGPLFSAPLYYFGKHVLGDPHMGCAYYNWVLFGIGLVVLARLLRGIVPAPVVRRFVLILVAGSMFTFHVGAYYGEVFTALCVGTGLLSVCLERRAYLGWIAIVLGVVNTPAAAVALGLVCAVLLFGKRRLRYALPPMAVVALCLLESEILRGRIHTAYTGTRGARTLLPYSGLPDFSYPIVLGILGLTVSVGKGVFFHAPGLLLRMREKLAGAPRLLATYRLWLLFLGGLLVVYAKWWSWYGGEFWGPRFLLFASLPASLALAVHLDERGGVLRAAAILAILTLSIWIGADGAIFGQENLGQCSANGYALEHLCWYVPEFTAWVRPFIVHHPLVGQDYVFFATYAAVYLRLAAPLVSYMASTARSPCVSWVRDVLEWRAWRF